MYLKLCKVTCYLCLRIKKFTNVHKLNVAKIASPWWFPVERDFCFVVIAGMSDAPYFAYGGATSAGLGVGIGGTECSIGGSVSPVQSVVSAGSLNEETTEIVARISL